jgi:hypothetical protein
MIFINKVYAFFHKIYLGIETRNSAIMINLNQPTETLPVFHGIFLRTLACKTKRGPISHVFL